MMGLQTWMSSAADSLKQVHRVAEGAHMARLSVRKRTFLRELAAAPAEVVARRSRIVLRRDQRWPVGHSELILPPESHLPFYVAHSATHAAEIVKRLAPSFERLTRVGSFG